MATVRMKFSSATMTLRQRLAFAWSVMRGREFRHLVELAAPPPPPVRDDEPTQRFSVPANRWSEPGRLN